jgi:hypothetical protein
VSDGLLPLNPATLPGGKVEDVEDLIGAGGADVIRQRLQVVGALLIEISRVMNTDPVGNEYALVTRNIAQRTSIPPNVTSVAASLVNVPLLLNNPLRKGAAFQAEHITNGGNLYIKAGIGATTVVYTVLLVPRAYWELPPPIYTGQIDAIWDGVIGSVKITEIA